MTLRITIPDQPSAADCDAVRAVLLPYNLQNGGDFGFRQIALRLTDEDDQSVDGGLWGKIVYDWMFVELLAVPEQSRGQGLGRALMQEAEQMARAHGCVGIWLDTYAFQARGFYEKLGFTLFGTIEDHPVGQRRFFLQKRL